MKGRTVLTIAHRLSTIRNANQIAVLERGKVVELGAYEALMAIPQGVFRRLVERQTIGATRWTGTYKYLETKISSFVLNSLR